MISVACLLQASFFFNSFLSAIRWIFVSVKSSCSILFQFSIFCP
jgi:hypothetical protein